MEYTNRFKKIAQLLFSSEVSSEEQDTAKTIVDDFDKIKIDLDNWTDAIGKNLEVFNNYHGNESSLVVITERFYDVQEQQKEKYEKIINEIKKTIELMNKIKDVEMEEMINNLSKTSEEYTKLYNELTDIPFKVGEAGFIQKFKEHSQKLVDNKESFMDVIENMREYIQNNVLGKKSLS